MSRWKKERPTEAEEQMIIVEWLTAKKIVHLHIPNEGKRSAHSATILKRVGLKKGFPDLLILEGYGGYFGLAIEVKQDRTYSPSEMRSSTWNNQKEWIRLLNEQNYLAAFCFGSDHAIKLIEMYLSRPKSIRDFYG